MNGHYLNVVGRLRALSASDALGVVNATDTPRNAALVALSYATRRELEDVVSLTIDGWRIERENMSTDLRRIMENHLNKGRPRPWVFRSERGTGHITEHRARNIIRDALERASRGE